MVAGGAAGMLPRDPESGVGRSPIGMQADVGVARLGERSRLGMNLDEVVASERAALVEDQNEVITHPVPRVLWLDVVALLICAETVGEDVIVIVARHGRAERCSDLLASGGGAVKDMQEVRA